MNQTILTPIRFDNAMWEGRLNTATPPRIEARYGDEVLPDVKTVPADEGCVLCIPVPARLLSEGVHNVIIWDLDTDQKLGSFSVVAGAPAEDDIRAEVALLRAELDMLKRAFRRLNHTDEAS